MPKIWAADSPGLPMLSEAAPVTTPREPAASPGVSHETAGSPALSAAHEEPSNDIGEDGDTRSEHETASACQTVAEAGGPTPSHLVKRKNVGRLSQVADLGVGTDPSVQPAKVLWKFMEEPQSGSGAWLWSVLMLSLIMLSCGAFVLETHVPLCCGRYDQYWLRIEEVCIAFFTLEYIVRFCACPMTFGVQEHTPAYKRAMHAGTYLVAHPDQRWNRIVLKEQLKCRLRFLVGPLNVIDLVAIVPFYIELILAATGGEMDLGLMRIVRLVRIFRLLKLGKYNDGLQLLATTMAQSVTALSMLCFVLSIVLIIFSAVLYFVEKGAWCDASNDFCNHRVPALGHGIQGGGPGWYYNRGDHEDAIYEQGCLHASYCRLKSQFQSIPVTMYWAMAAITTTGYGDLVPMTWLGKVFACLIMFLGLLLLALPITVISGNFATIYASQELIKFEQSQGQKMKKKMMAQFDPPPSSELDLMHGEEGTADLSRQQSGSKFGWQADEEDLGSLHDDASIRGGAHSTTVDYPRCASVLHEQDEEHLGDAWRNWGSDVGSAGRGQVSEQDVSEQNVLNAGRGHECAQDEHSDCRHYAALHSACARGGGGRAASAAAAARARADARLDCRIAGSRFGTRMVPSGSRRALGDEAAESGGVYHPSNSKSGSVANGRYLALAGARDRHPCLCSGLPVGRVRPHQLTRECRCVAAMWNLRWICKGF